MSWLTPLGFLGLIGLIVLILIYIIKPNYQNKIISSTFVWKLSLKYKKNKMPLNKLRNILIFLCQVFVITSCAFILAQPFLASETEETNKKVLIIDASASMMTATGSYTRFERAVDEARKEVDKVLEMENGEVSIILAGDSASFLVQNATAKNRAQIKTALDSLVDSEAGSACTFGDADIDGAIKLSEEMTALAANTEVILYTDTEYIDPGRVKIHPVRDVNDWNASILDVRAISFDGALRFEIDVACYGKNDTLRVYCDIEGVRNDTTKGDETITLNLVADVNCSNDEVQTIVFGIEYEDDMGYELTEVVDVDAYDKVSVRIDERDSLEYDNSFYLYGGTKHPLRVLYASTVPNNFFSTQLLVLREQLKYRWNVIVTPFTVTEDDLPPTKGYDLYIYEHYVPEMLPDDGVVLLSDPGRVPDNAGFRLGGTRTTPDDEDLNFLSIVESHPITKSVDAEKIHLWKYMEITSYDGYTPLLSCEGNTVMIAKNDPDSKIVVMSFSLHYSDLAVLLDFPMMIYNIVEYYTPSTVTQYVFDAGESVTLGSRSEELKIMGPGIDTVITEFPFTLPLKYTGVYTVEQTPISNEEVYDKFFVRMPASESNINSVEDSLDNPYFVPAKGVDNMDLLFYLSIALVLLLFVEWWLHTREQY